MLISCDLRVAGCLTGWPVELSLSFVAFPSEPVTKRAVSLRPGQARGSSAKLPVGFAEAVGEEVLFDGGSRATGLRGRRADFVGAVQAAQGAGVNYTGP